MDSLPDEIIVKILSFLPTSDLFQFLNACDKYSYFLKEKSVIQILNFKFMCQFSNFHIVPYVLNKIEYNYIKVLNINYLYWIPLQDIRELLSKLHVLEEFYALDTNIGVREKDIFLYGRLKKLSISVAPDQLENNKTTDFYYNCLYQLQKLCLKFNLKRANFEELYRFLSALKKLIELWIYDNDEESGIHYERIVVNLSTLNKLVIKSRRALPVLDLSCWGLIKIFQSKRYEFAEEIIFERISLIIGEYPVFCPENPVEESWEILKSLHCDVPWGPNDAEKARLKLFTMDGLPIEVVIKILSYLNSYDLMQFSKAFEHYICLLQEKNIVRIVDFSGKFEAHNINICKYIATSLNYNHIKVLNINYLYWIPNQDLRKLIKKLENLEVLYAINTKLGIKDKDIAEYIKLKKLAISVEDNQFDHSTVTASKNLTPLRSLCLKITQRMEEYNGIYLFFRELKQLEEVWISDEVEGTYRINYGQIAVLLNNLKKFVIKSKTVLPYYDFSYTGLVKVFECKRSESATELVFEKTLTKSDGVKPSIFDPAENDYERSWQIFQSLHKDTPYGPKESQIIHSKKSIEEVYFEDLNFCHTIILCNLKYIDAALKILSCKNSSKLKRLSFRSCLFQNNSEKTKEEPTSGFKRSRRGVQINTAFHPFQTIANNLKSLRELEILTCPGCATGAVISAYPLIAIFQYLEKLVLEIPLLLDGSFLKEVFTKCPHLESLYLFCKGQNDKFIINLCQNLKYSQNLRHFRLDYTEVPITKLLNSFNEIEQKKLLRIFVKCDNLRGADNQEESFSVFMENNPQLIFCGFVISSNTKKQNTDLQRTINKFKDGNPAKVFFIKKDISSLSGIFPIPTAHHDFIFYRTNVAVINIDDF